MNSYLKLKSLVFIISFIFLVSCTATTKKIESANQQPLESEIQSVNLAKKIHKKQIKGVDVSKYQGIVDFAKLQKMGIYYVFIRATEGITYQDADYKRNHAKAKEARLTVGVYHFYETNDDPHSQFDNFKNLVNLTAGDLAPVIDIEKLHQNDDKELVANLKLFLDKLETHYGIKPIVYTGKNFANKYLSDFGDYPLWLAEYQVTEPQVPNGWQKWTFWQWSQKGTVDGIEGTVDMDRFNGDLHGFEKMLLK